MKVHHQTMVSAIASAALLLLMIPTDIFFAQATGIFDPPDHIQEAHGIVNSHANSALRGDHPGQGQVVTPPNQTPASPEDCVIVAIAGTRHPDWKHQLIDDKGGHDSHDRRINQLFQHNNYDDGEIFVCKNADGTTVPIIFDSVQFDDMKNSLHGTSGVPSFRSGEMVLSRGLSWIGGDGSIHVPHGITIASYVRENNNLGRHGGRHLRGRQQSRRRTAEVVGNKHVLIIIADFLDYPYTGMGHYSDANYPTPADKAAAVSDDVFGDFSGIGSDTINLAQQLYDCSFGKLSILPTPGGETLSNDQFNAACLVNDTGVIWVNMAMNLTEYTTEDSIRNEMKALAEAKLEDATGTSIVLPGPFDHVIFVRDRCLEGINGGCGYAAYAAVNDWFQMFVERYVAYASIHVHEMGHNLNLAHSGSIGFSSNPDMTGDVFYNGTDSNGFVQPGDYTDHTCSMGNPLYSDDTGKICFNAAKNFQIQGWYDNAKITIDPAGFNGPPTYSWAGDILGVGEYDLRGANNWPVSIKVETGTPNDYFVGFNRAAGPNLHNDLADDMVTIIQTGQDGDGYSQSYLHMLLDATAEYSKFQILNFKKTTRGTGLPLTVKVNSIDIASTPGSANVFIGYENCTDMAPAYCGSTKDYPLCFNSNCLGQGLPDTELDGCNHVPIDNCCGNELCEPGEDRDTCGFDCYVGPFGLVAEKCTNCHRDAGMMFDIEAKADGDLTVTGLDYYPWHPYTLDSSTVWYEVWAKAGTLPVTPNYDPGTNLADSGWANVASVTACGFWKFCKITFSQSLQVPRGTYMGFVVTGVGNDIDLLFYAEDNSTVLEDDFMNLHPARPFVNYVGGTASDFLPYDRTFNGVIPYYVDMTPIVECTSDDDCDDGLFCNGNETCVNWSCQAGTDFCGDEETCTEPSCGNGCEGCSESKCTQSATCNWDISPPDCVESCETLLSAEACGAINGCSWSTNTVVCDTKQTCRAPSACGAGCTWSNPAKACLGDCSIETSHCTGSPSQTCAYNCTGPPGPEDPICESAPPPPTCVIANSPCTTDGECCSLTCRQNGRWAGTCS